MEHVFQRILLGVMQRTPGFVSRVIPTIRTFPIAAVVLFFPSITPIVMLVLLVMLVIFIISTNTFMIIFRVFPVISFVIMFTDFLRSDNQGGYCKLEGSVRVAD